MTSPLRSSPYIAGHANPRGRLRLFCFPYAGGGASVFHAWAKGLPQEIHVCPVQLPGRENRLLEKPFDRLTPLVGALLQDLPPYLDLPFALFGHSLGALVGFELARALRRHYHVEPVRLFVSAQRAPQQVGSTDRLHHLPDNEFVRELQRRYNGIPEPVRQNRELMGLFLPILKADFAILETYAYSAEPPLSCPISGFRGTRDAQIPPEDFDAWRQQTTQDFTPREVEGRHFFINEARDFVLRAVASDLGRDLRS